MEADIIQTSAMPDAVPRVEQRGKRVAAERRGESVLATLHVGAAGAFFTGWTISRRRQLQALRRSRDELVHIVLVQRM